jgi:hypothetical protein
MGKAAAACCTYEETVRGLSRKELGKAGGRAVTNSSGLASAGHVQVMNSTELITFSYYYSHSSNRILLYDERKISDQRSWGIRSSKRTRCDKLQRKRQGAKSRGVHKIWHTPLNSARDLDFAAGLKPSEQTSDVDFVKSLHLTASRRLERLIGFIRPHCCPK